MEGLKKTVHDIPLLEPRSEPSTSQIQPACSAISGDHGHDYGVEYYIVQYGGYVLAVRKNVLSPSASLVATFLACSWDIRSPEMSGNIYAHGANRYY